LLACLAGPVNGGGTENTGAAWSCNGADSKQVALFNGSIIGAQRGFQLLISRGAWIKSLNFLTLNFIKD